jgi:aspartyl-tRNA(Asn)/glutamyl-tRNA(Gln) amidotransferase subunit A
MASGKRTDGNWERLPLTLVVVCHRRAEWTAEQLTSAVMGRKTVYNAAWRFFRRYDLLLTPTLAVPGFEQGIQGAAEIGGHIVEPFYWLSFTFPFDINGQPAVTMPTGWATDGLPVGL